MSVQKAIPSKIDYLNGQIFGEFCRIEREFYRKRCAAIRRRQGVDLSKFFHRQRIGDEIWILCDAGNRNSRTGHALIDAAIQWLCGRGVPGNGKSNGPAFDHISTTGTSSPSTSPIKIFMDLVSHASSIGRIRDDAL